MTLEPLLQTGINERKRHHASQSSHNARHNQWRANQLGPVCVGMRHPTDPVIGCDIRRNPAHRARQDIRDVRNPIPIDFQSRTSDRLRMPRHTRLDRTQQPASHQAHTRQITHVTAYTTRKKSPPSNPSYVPSASPRTPRHTQPDRTTTTPPSGISIRHATACNGIHNARNPAPNRFQSKAFDKLRMPRHTHNQTEGAEQLQNLPAPGGSACQDTHTTPH